MGRSKRKSNKVNRATGNRSSVQASAQGTDVAVLDERPAGVSDQGLYKHLTEVSPEISAENTSRVNKALAGIFKKPKNAGDEIFKIRQASTGDIRAQLDSVESSANLLLASQNRAPVLNWVKASREALEDEKAQAKKQEILAKARAGDAESIKILSETLREQVATVIMTKATYLQFYNYKNISHNDKVYLYTEIPSEVNVEVMGEDGGIRTVQGRRNKGYEWVTMWMLSSDLFEYSVLDLYDGWDVKEAVLATIDIVMDLTDKLETILQAPILVGTPNSRIKGTFNTTGDLADRDYVVRSRVQKSNLPTGNLIALNDNTATTTFRHDVILAALKYATQWGSGAFADGDLKIESILVPSKDAADLNETFTATGNSNKHQDALVEGSPFKIHFNGQDITIIPDSSLDATQGYCYVQFNKKVGNLYEKGELAKTHIFNGATSPQLALTHKEQTAHQKVYGLALPKHWTMNALAIQYRS